MDNELIFIALAGLGVIVFMIFIFLFVKDSENTKKLRQFEKSIEDLNLQIYKLQKKLKESELTKDNPEKNMEHLLRIEFKKELASHEKNFQKAIESLESTLIHHKEELSDRISILEEKIRETLYLPPTSSIVDENKIISMFKNGWSIDSIAKELGISKGEVEFTLKLSNIR